MPDQSEDRRGRVEAVRTEVRNRRKADIMQIRTVAMIGAGNVGAFVVRGLDGALGENLWVIAEGERRARLQREGIIINDVPYALHVRTPEEAKGADLIIIGVKYAALRGILPAVRTIASPHTLVMSLMNGVDSEEILSEVVPKERIVPAMIRFVADRDGNRIHIRPTQPGLGIRYGAVNGVPAEESLCALDALFAASELEAERDDQILISMWSKFAFNICENLPQAILDVGIGCYEDSEHAARIRTSLWNETRLVAAAEGVAIPPETKHISSPQYPKDAIYSTLQDLRARRKTEVEMFAGTLVRLADAHGLAVPVAETVYHLICALEEKNDGCFRYEP